MNEEQNIERIEALLRKGSFAQLSAEDKAFMREQGIDEQAFRFLAQSIVPDPEPVPALPEAMRQAVLSHFDAHAPQHTSSNGSSSPASGKTGGSALRMQIFKYTAIAAVSIGAVVSVFFLLNSNKQQMREDVAVVKEHDNTGVQKANEAAPMLPASADTLRRTNAAELSAASSTDDADLSAEPEVSYGYGAGIPVTPGKILYPEEERKVHPSDSVRVAEFNGYVSDNIYRTSASNTIVRADKAQRSKEGAANYKWSNKGTKSEAYNNDKEQEAKAKKEDQQLDEIVVSQSRGPGRTAMPQYPSIEEVANARYKGGYPAFDKFLAENLKVPAYRSNYTQIENTVVMEIDINKNGIISRRALVSSPDTQLTREVNLVLDKIPPFTKGKNVTVQIPFRFR